MDRWWIYQQERFPIFKHGVLIAVFAAAAVCYSILLRDGAKTAVPPERLPVGAIAIAFISLFLCFLQLRIADEFKDFADDARYRPYRPVPRGLVTLRELGLLAIAVAAIQLGLAVSVGFNLVLLLAVVWGYMVLMSREFFVRDWLKAKPVAYLLSHAVIMPLLALYATACEWVTTTGTPPPSLGWFLLLSLLISLAIELGRKIRAPHDEETGVETYSALWGIQRAAIAWLTIMWLVAIAALLAAAQVELVAPTALLLLPLLTLAMGVTWRFLARPNAYWSKGFEVATGLWTLGVYLAVGVVPLWVRSLSISRFITG